MTGKNEPALRRLQEVLSFRWRLPARWRKPCAAAILALLLMAVGDPAQAVPLRGKLSLLARSGNRPVRTVSAEEAVVLFEPSGPTKGATALRAGTFSVATRNKQYQPRVLIIGSGSTVSFPNEDVILHNVFSVSGANSFDFGLYGKGPGKSRRFDETGLVRIFCNVHRDMVAYLWVSQSLHVTRPAADGSYLLDVPEGRGKLTVWHERADAQELELQVGRAGSVRDLQLRITRPRVPQHLDKDGKPYPATRDGYE